MPGGVHSLICAHGGAPRGGGNDGGLRLSRASFAQQRLWFLEQLVGGSSSYNLDLALRLEGALDVDALERTLQEIVQRHEVLRTTFAEIDGQPMQVIAAELAVPLRQVDLRSRADAAVEAERPFDLARGPLLRATLIRIAAHAR